MFEPKFGLDLKPERENASNQCFVHFYTLVPSIPLSFADFSARMITHLGLQRKTVFDAQPSEPLLRWSGKTGHESGVSQIVNDVQNEKKIQSYLQGESGH